MHSLLKCKQASELLTYSLLTRIPTPSFLYLIDSGNEGRVKYTPPPPTHGFSAGSFARIFGLLLLVDAERCER
jgi:hypothetical protein